MKNKLSTLIVAGGLLFSGFASAATYQLCSTLGCRIGGTVSVTSTCAKTKYPLVLAHGIMGFSSVAGIEYFL